ncbi:uncharacterized protein YndB with AHSA1/START domain [Sphingomonas naasensis]|uniref:ATPase n=1 Tax=Sphingomonas naasensis TaxID=1344951 RepID=A0A4S1WA28_9SPHN|nr:SRPBCC family protein [Sphingomonas naasensis]NIJ19540.1 uncharacterized protein YndB with AHSA1/START domain [Sphingomonas naasensis]TGX39273.1 ATPase [Sphingomonas naasensis]
MAGRTDRATRIVAARRATVYRALTDADLLVRWLPPAGMTGRFEAFDARPGGRYRMILRYLDADEAGKSGGGEDVIEGRFVALEPGERVVQSADFESNDPAFAGTMIMEWVLRDLPGGTEVAIECRDVPAGISAEDHAAGLASSLENLAALLEAPGTND